MFNASFLNKLKKTKQYNDLIIDRYKLNGKLKSLKSKNK